jgi:GntR family transcriptional regulator of vanillate catabolism
MISDLIARLHRVPFVAPTTIAFDRKNFEEMYDDLFHAHRQHRAITEALENGEGMRVEALLKEHVYSQKQSMNLLSYRLEAPAGFSRAAATG